MDKKLFVSENTAENS